MRVLPDYIQKTTIIANNCKYSPTSSISCSKRDILFYLHKLHSLSDQFRSNNPKYNGKQKSLELCLTDAAPSTLQDTLQELELLPWKGNALSAESILVRHRRGWFFSIQCTQKAPTNALLLGQTHWEPRNVRQMTKGKWGHSRWIWVAEVGESKTTFWEKSIINPS